MELHFTKMAGAGNDFIVIDNRTGIIAEENRAIDIARWCRRRVDVGADGVLLVEPTTAPGADFRMRYYNADGGEAESCGNGARCIARFAHNIGAAPASLAFETLAGVYRAEVGKNDVLLSMSDPQDLRRDIALEIPDLFSGKVDFINTGVPHAVITVADLEKAQVVPVGRAIRHHAQFAPAGTNVNFMQLRADGGVNVRTYERGVEDETLACGTGAVASALIAQLHGHGKSPLHVHTRGGNILCIHFTLAEGGAGKFSSIKLQGEARVVYEGVMHV